MQNSSLVADILDKCGEPVKAELDAFVALNELMTVLDAMNLELMQSGKGRAVYKVSATLAAGVREGVIADAAAFDGYEEAYEILTSGSPPREAIAIYDDFQDLVAAEESGERAMIFTGLNGTNYTLSWKPDQALNIELWGNKVSLIFSRADFHTESNIPDLFESLAVLRASFGTLDHLLLPDVKKDYTRFVSARKGTMAMGLGVLEGRWSAFRGGIRDDGTTLRRRWYDPIEDLMAP